ncbi:MAG TPA: diguanylate cyclase [Thermodesulfobacteriota bacterium]|nr:diguanylate cyclase [Thermodesulfobacteriota bacterium]
MKKYTDFKNKITYSNFLLGKVLILLLSALIFILIYRNSFHSLNFYSALATLLLLATAGYRTLQFVRTGSRDIPLLERLELSILYTLVFEIFLEIFGNDIFPLSFLLVPVLIYGFGWAGGIISFSLISILRISMHFGTDALVELSLLMITTLVIGYLLKGDKERLGSYMFQRSSGKNIILPALISGGGEKNDSGEPVGVKALKNEIRSSLSILCELVPNHSIVLYMKMDDGLYAIADFISKSKDYIDRGQRLGFRGGYLGWVLKTKTQVLITSIKNVRKNLVYYNKNVPIKALLATPLYFKGDREKSEGVESIFGMLVVDSFQQDAFGDKEKLIVSLISDRIVEIIDRFLLSEKVYLSSQELNSFYDFTQKLNSTSDVDVILDHIIDTLTRLFEADFVGISLVDKEGGYSNLKRISDGMKEYLEDKEIPHDDTLIGFVAESGKHFHFDDISARSQYRSVFGKEIDFALGIKNIKSVLIYPFHETYQDVDNVGQVVLGSVVIGRRTKNPFNEGEISLAKIICRESAKSMTSSLNFQKVKELAIRDGLTGLYNHRHFQEMLSYTIVHSDRYSAQASLLMIDVDDLKVINDTYGHQAGDTVLSSIGNILSETLRKVDIPARYGGDEFAVILPNTNKTGSIAVAEKIRSRLKRVSLRSDSRELQVTFSIGIATYPQCAASKELLIEKTDRALYESKNNGKNKITHYEDISLEELGS